MSFSLNFCNRSRLRQLLWQGVPRFALLAAGGLAVCSAKSTISATPVYEEIAYSSTIANDANGPLDLRAELNYDASKANAPIVVVMHPYGGVTPLLNINAQRLRDAGFFVVSPTMRGQGGSDGTRDSGGAEIYDIYDAVEYVKSTYPQYVDPTNISITGYSGGGGNVMSALTKLPDYFRAGSAYFGMSDYGYDTTNGWFFNGADAGNKASLVPDIGDPTTNDPAVQDRYMARASNLAAKNNPYSEIQLFVNADEWNVPPINATSYRDNAISAASFAGEFGNIHVHIGGNGEYVDFNGNSINDPNELQDWPHQLPTAEQQQAAEAWYQSRLLDGSIPQPTLSLQDTLFVAGFVRTERFRLWLGDGQNAAADLVYDLSGNEWSFELSLLSNDQSVEGTILIDTADFAGQEVTALRNGQIVDQFLGGQMYQFTDFGNGDQLALSVVPETGSGLLLVVGGGTIHVFIRQRRVFS
jgi:dienelactone hydrolase